MQVLTIIASLLTIVIGLWRYFGRKAAYRRKLADEAKAKLDKANSENGNASDFLDAFGDVHK